MKKKLLHTVLALLILTVSLLGAADYWIEDTLSCRTGSPLSTDGWIQIQAQDRAIAADTHTDVRYNASLLGILPLKQINVRQYGDIRLCPGGMPFGAKMFTDGLIVVGFTDVDCSTGSRQPARDAGVRVKDIVLKINGVPVGTAENMGKLVAGSEGKPLIITLRRDKEEITVTVTPSLSASDNVYKTGMWVRDNTAGIGTVTFIEPKSGSFAGLGHGICDAETGSLLPLSRGVVVDVTINGIQKGQSGAPGELKGHFASGKMGSLLGNTHAGVFGIMTSLPDGVKEETALPIALKNEMHDGEATILCTLDEGGIRSYQVNVRKLKNSMDNKNMEITVTDPALLEKTGGIVQGMSGSPIIQDGRIIGAVTHVLINDPTKGYGIFIENMLDAVR